MAGTWSVEETKALIAVWGQESVQREMDRVHRNRDIYQRVATELSDYEWEQCRNKIKNLTQRYRKVAMLCIALVRIDQFF